MLLENGADFNARGGGYVSALQNASLLSNPEPAEMLLRHGADINAVGGVYGTALQAAAWYGNVAVAKMLILKGANVSAEGGHDYSPLGAALASGELELAQLLIANGAILRPSRNGEDTLLQAIREDQGPRSGSYHVLMEERAVVNVQQRKFRRNSTGTCSQTRQGNSSFRPRSASCGDIASNRSAMNLS